MVGKTEARVELQGVSIYYNKLQVIKNVSLTLPSKEITAIIGPSGSGKSTLLRAINRMNDHIQGMRIEGLVSMDGQNIYGEKVDVVALRRRIGMVFQRPNPFPKSIYDNVTYGPKLHGKISKTELDVLVEKSLRQAALWDEVKDRLNSSGLDLSGGQQQRLCIARSLAVEPQILLMDEPASALDPAATAKIEDLMLKLKQDLTVVIVTHNMQQAARVSDKTAFLLSGELVEFDVTKKLFTAPRDKRTDDYISGKMG
ncbi:MAG: phosphate transport system ATP-binding protein [Bacillota bacterium]|nr:MAG: phosphate transport system ATP-binding protein [Bacillota bacterium]MBS3949271.1 phosphate ABC transporter ATP-binding protein [Peptococcaceae bacterium]